MINPKISIVMAVFNSAKYVGQAIGSILSQTFRDFEFIIVDDGSTDRSSEIVSSFKDPRIVYIRNDENCGQTNALNIGIRRSCGRYIARMDADDVAFPKRLQIQYKFLEENPEISVLGSWCIFIDQDGRFIRVFQTPEDSLSIRCYLAASGNLTMWSMAHPTVLMRKSALEDVGFYNEPEGYAAGYPQDYELWERLSRKYRFANINKPLLKYRVLPNSDSRNSAGESFNQCFEITLKKIKHYLPYVASEETLALANMLEFRPQVSALNGVRVLRLFDAYFTEYMKQFEDNQTVNYYKERIKLYYLGQLFATNRWLSIKEFFTQVFRNPSCLFDKRLYSKLAKAFLDKKVGSDKGRLKRYPPCGYRNISVISKNENMKLNRCKV